MSDYAPTEPGDMNMEVDEDHDPMRMPMDALQFVHRLTPPPEELVQGRDSQGFFCPIYVPSKQATALQSESFEFCGCQAYLIEPELGISEDGQTTFSPELVKGGRLVELMAMNKLQVGVPIVEEVAREMAKELHIRIIGSRWVLTSKTVEGKNQCRMCRSGCSYGSSVSTESRHL